MDTFREPASREPASGVVALLGGGALLGACLVGEGALPGYPFVGVAWAGRS